MKIKIAMLLTILLVLLVLIVSSEASYAQETQELTRVRVGVTPYSMWQIWSTAHELGIDKEFGLDFEIKEFTSDPNGVRALITGDVDITSNAMPQLITDHNAAPQVVSFVPVGYFKGFIFVGRKGKTRPIDELIDEMGVDKAKEFQLKEMRGKTFLVVPPFKPIVLDALNQVGLKEEDVSFQFFADDQKAAMAFIKGSGDFYIGSLPQERRLLEMSDQFVNAGGSEILGPAGLWYDIQCSTEKFIRENRETSLRVLAVKYRATYFFDLRPNEFAEIASKNLSRLTGGNFPTEEYITLQTVYDDFLSIEESLAGCYNSLSPLYLLHPTEYYLKIAVESGDIKEPYLPEEIYKDAEDLFYELLTRRDLLEKIYAPFTD